MKKCCLLVFKFIKYGGAIAFFCGQHVALAETQNSYPCVVAQSCDTGDCDSIIQKVSVDYYDDLGSRYRWTHKVRMDKGLTDCEAAIREHFPYEYGACEQL